MVRGLLGCAGWESGCAGSGGSIDVPPPTLAALQAVVGRTAKMAAPPIFNRVPARLNSKALALLLDGGMVAFPLLDGVPTLATRRRAPVSRSKWPSDDLGSYYRDVVSLERQERFATHKLLIEHGWPVTTTAVDFSTCAAPDTAEGLAYVETLANAVGASPILAAMRCDKRFLTKTMLGRPGARVPAVEAVAKLGKPWALELVSSGGGSGGAVSCISRSMLPNAAALLARGVDPNRKCSDGVAPLTAAFVECNLGAATALLTAGARADAAGAYWAIRTEADWALRQRFASNWRQVRPALLALGAPNGASHCDGATVAVSKLSESPSAEVRRALASDSFDANATDLRLPFGDSLLHVAARADLEETVRRLLDAGAAADRPNAEARTALDVAGPDAAAALRARGAKNGDPAAIATVDRRRAEEARQEDDARERRRERRQQREADERRADQEAAAADRRASEAREAQARRDMPNTGVDTDAFRRWALGGSQGTARPSGSPSGSGRGASAPAPPPPSTRASSAGSTGARETPARTGSSSASSPPPARALPTNVCADWANACQPYRNKRDACEAGCQQDVGRSMTACVERRAAGEKGVKFIQANTECQRELEPTKKACGPRCASEHRCPTPQPPECRGSGGNGGTAL